MKQVFAVALFALFANEGQACHPKPLPPPPVVIAPPPIAPPQPQQPIIISPQIHLPPDFGRGRGRYGGGRGGCINGRYNDDWIDDDRRISRNRRNRNDLDFDQYADLRGDNSDLIGSVSRSTSRSGSSNINSKLSSSSYSNSFSSRGGCSTC